jgi:DNA polymerase-4
MRVIFHADLDAFFAAVEQHDRPELRGRPVLVGGAPEARGVVSAASYEARRYGARSAMPMRTALRLCPPGTVRVPPRFERYAAVSRQVMDLFRACTPLVEPLSLDEAYLDMTAPLAAAGAPTPAEAAQALKRAVREHVGLSVSVGVATSKSVAKIASDLNKPDGLVVVPPGEERRFLAPLPAERLWGVGPKVAARLHRAGIRTIGDIAAADPRWLAHIFGRWGELLHALARGVDDRPVSTSREVKSVGRETTFPHDVEERARLAESLRALAAQVAERLRRHGLRGRTVTLKLRQHDFRTVTRQTRLPLPTDRAEIIAATALQLLAGELTEGARVRLVGVTVSGFEPVTQLLLPLFAGDEAVPWSGSSRDEGGDHARSPDRAPQGRTSPAAGRPDAAARFP